MNNVTNDNTATDKNAMRRLGMAIMAMSVGAIGLAILAITIGHLH